jgi:hypothetical protein
MRAYLFGCIAGEGGCFVIVYLFKPGALYTTLKASLCDGWRRLREIPQQQNSRKLHVRDRCALALALSQA